MKRILKAFTYSYSGFKFAIKEPAFYQEFALTIAAIITLIFLPFSWEAKTCILVAHILTMIVELLNTAIEAVVDLASPEIHPLAKMAKDIGSLAVLFSFIIVILAWMCPTLQHFNLI